MPARQTQNALGAKKKRDWFGVLPASSDNTRVGCPLGFGAGVVLAEAVSRKGCSLARRIFRTTRAGLIGIGAWVALASPVAALDLVLNYQPSAPDAVSPAFDPTGVLLADVFSYVEGFYEGVFEDNHTLTINFWYADIGGLGLQETVTQSGGRETESSIRIGTTDGNGQPRAWFFDPTPDDSAEFDMGQTLWRDLSAVDRADWYNATGTIPDTFEAGYGGTALAPAAANAFDLLSVVMHEVGHSLGMSFVNQGTKAEATADGDFDFDPISVFGADLAVEAADIFTNDNRNIAHLDSTAVAMRTFILAGNRFLPSHTDLLAMAAGHNYTQLDLPRREFFGNGDWNTNANWSGNRAPQLDDDVFIRDAQGPGVNITAALSADGYANHLDISEGAHVQTHSFRLEISGNATLRGASSQLTVATGGELHVGTLQVREQAQLQLFNQAEVFGGDITITDGAALIVTGAATIYNNLTFTPDATLQPDANATLTVAGTLELGGALDLVLIANDAPAPYTPHTLLDGQSTRTGRFSQVLGINLGNGLGLAITYAGNDVIIQSALRGDANLNGQVEQGDLDMVLLNWGETLGVSWATGDLTGNGQVEQADLDLILQQWGTLAAPNFTTAVPEPAAAALLALILATGPRRQRHRKSMQ